MDKFYSMDGIAIKQPTARFCHLFCGRRHDRLKALYWEGDGFVLLYKRLEKSKFQWLKNAEAVRGITRQEFRWLMEGLSNPRP